MQILIGFLKFHFKYYHLDTVSGKGNASESIYGGLFEDESFAVQHNKRGIVGMANNGRHTNGSQFYITLQPAPFMDKKYVAFG
jgi:peptidyl-prolyl cis-trans isomerase-like 6